MKTINQISAGGIVYKKVKDPGSKIYDLKWLICQHSQHKGWVFPKGLVGDEKTDESMEEAAIREVEEEGGVMAKIITNKPIITNYQYEYKNNLIQKTVYYYIMEYISGDPDSHDWEISQAKFITATEIEKILSYNSDKQAFKSALDFFK